MFEIAYTVTFQGKGENSIGFSNEVIKWVEKEFDLDKITKEFAEALMLEIETNIKTATDVYGIAIASYAPLSEATKKRKGNNIIFFDSGIFYNSVKMTDIGKGYLIYIGEESRKEVAVYLNNGTNKMPKRDFWDLVPATVSEILNEVLFKAA